MAGLVQNFTFMDMPTIDDSLEDKSPEDLKRIWTVAQTQIDVQLQSLSTGSKGDTLVSKGRLQHWIGVKKHVLKEAKARDCQEVKLFKLPIRAWEVGSYGLAGVTALAGGITTVVDLALGEPECEEDQGDQQLRNTIIRVSFVSFAGLFGFKVWIDRQLKSAETNKEHYQYIIKLKDTIAVEESVVELIDKVSKVHEPSEASSVADEASRLTYNPDASVEAIEAVAGLLLVSGEMNRLLPKEDLAPFRHVKKRSELDMEKIAEMAMQEVRKRTGHVVIEVGEGSGKETEGRT